jgi:hypothetical protein
VATTWFNMDDNDRRQLTENKTVVGLLGRIANWLNLTAVATVVALLLSVFNFYFSYLYVSNRLAVTSTEAGYDWNGLYMTVVVSNGGNRDAAILRIEPALWSPGETACDKRWQRLETQVHPEVPIVSPKTPMVLKAGGVAVLELSALLPFPDVERMRLEAEQGTFVGIRVVAVSSDGRRYQLERPVVRLDTRASSAAATIPGTVDAFAISCEGPPGTPPPSADEGPYVWLQGH